MKLVALVAALALLATLPLATATGAPVKRKSNPCAKLKGKRKRACKKKHARKPAPAPTPAPAPAPAPAPGGSGGSGGGSLPGAGANLTRDDAGARAQIVNTKLTNNSEGSQGGLNQNCVSFGDGQYRATYDYSNGLTSGQTVEAGRWQLVEGYKANNLPDTWGAIIELETSKGGERIEVDTQGGGARIITGSGSAFTAGDYSRQTNATSYC